MSPRTWVSLVVLFGALTGLGVLGPGWSAPESDKPAKTITNSLGMKLVLIPAGKFLMGSPAGEGDREAFGKGSEKQHEVEITRPFYVGVHEVTQSQYKAVMGENPSDFARDGEYEDRVKGLDTSQFPVEQVSWNDAVKFCQKLTAREKNKHPQRQYRLPTEAEWEYACRGGASSYQTFHFGNSLSSTQANFDGNYPYGKAKKGPDLKRTCKVGSYKPNKFGLHDMHGNVHEWCSDWFDPGYYKNSPGKNPRGPEKGKSRVLRGGSWYYAASYSRSACRFGFVPQSRVYYVGFRVVCDSGAVVTSR